MAWKIVNEIQGDFYYSQNFSIAQIQELINIGVIVHVQTTVVQDTIIRYFVPVDQAHDFEVNFVMAGSIPPENLVSQLKLV